MKHCFFSRDEHLQKLDLFCRTCGRRIRVNYSYANPKPAQYYAGPILDLLNVDILQDDHGVLQGVNPPLIFKSPHWGLPPLEQISFSSPLFSMQPKLMELS